MTKQVFVRGCKVYYGTLQGIIVDVERNAQKVSVLMESGRFRKNLSIKALYINPRWTVTSQVASQAEIDSMISAYESLTDTIYSAKVEIVSNTGMVCHSFKTLSVPSTTSVLTMPVN